MKFHNVIQKNVNHWAILFWRQIKKFLVAAVIMGATTNCIYAEQIADIILDEQDFIVFVTTITQITLPNDNRSFTTIGGENEVICTAIIRPDVLNNYNNTIAWGFIDNPNVSGNSGNPCASQTGSNVTLTVSAPAAQNGRGHPLSYQITASVTIDSAEHISEPKYITQDGVDQCRQEYIDMGKNETPGRNEFVDVHTYNNPGNFTFNEINSGQYSFAIFSIAQNLQNIRNAIGNLPMPVTSGYRNPIHNENIEGAENSRHIYGDAVDIALQDWNGDGIVNQDDWLLMYEAADAEGATYIDPFERTPTWIHMDWR